MDAKTVIERAFELAGSGECTGVKAIKDRLRSEGHTHAHVEDQLYGKTIAKQLKGICDATKLMAGP